MAYLKAFYAKSINLNANSKYVTLDAPTGLGASYTLTLPTQDGSAGALLQYDSAGALKWVPGQQTQQLWVSLNGNDSTGNGTLTNPYLTIQHALDQVPQATDAASMRRTWVINVTSGQYNESLSIDIAKKKIIVQPHGMVSLGAFATTGWLPSGTTADVTITCSVSSYDSISPSFSINSSLIASPEALVSSFRIAGSLIVSSTGSQSLDCSLSNVIFYGWDGSLVGNNASINASGWTGTLTLELEQCQLMGQVTGSTDLQKCQDTTFSKLVTINRYGYFKGCTLTNGMTWSAAPNRTPSGFYDSNLTGTYTSTSTLQMDDPTNKTFIDNSAALAGGATKVLLRYFTDSEFQISNATTLSKVLKFDASLISASTTRTITAPDVNLTLTQYSGPDQSVATTGTPTFVDLTVGAANLFNVTGSTGNVVIGGTCSLAAGTVGLPSLYWSTDTTTGFYRIGANNLGWSCSGSKVVDLSSGGLGITAGSASTPSLYWSTDTTSGFYRTGANTLGLAFSGTKMMDMSSAGIGLTAGLVGTPSLYWSTDTTTGFYRIGSNNLGLACSGSKVLDISSAGLGLTAGLVGTPSLYWSTDTTTGFYRIGANNLGWSCSGTKVLDFSSAGLGLTAGTVSAPSLYWSTDNTTGFYRIGSNNLGLACSGAKVLDVSSTGLGITGTTTSSSDLTVNSSSIFKVTASSGDTALAGFLAVGTTTTTRKALIYQDANSVLQTEIQNRDTSVGTGAASALLLSTGVSGTGPTLTMQVNGSGHTTASQLLFSGNSTVTSMVLQLAGAYPIKMNLNGADCFEFFSNARLGIGTLTSASYDLSFRGNADKQIGIERAESSSAGKKMTILAGAATSGGSNLAGGDLELVSGVSTGTGNSRLRLMRMGRATSSGTGDNISYETLIIPNVLLLSTTATTESIFSLSVPATAGSVAAQVMFTVVFTNATDAKTHCGGFTIAASNGTALNSQISVSATLARANSTGANPTVTWTILEGTNLITIRLQHNGGLTTPVANYLYLMIYNLGNQAVTFLI